MSTVNALAEKYRNGYLTLAKLIEGLSDEQLGHIPPHADAWSIKEHIIHLADSELNGFIRLKSIIAQPGSQCYVMEEEGWTRNLRRKKENLRRYLSIFSLIREMAYDFVIEEPESTWNDLYFIRTYKDKTIQITIEKWLEFYSAHLDFHVEYIAKIIAELRSLRT